jgi:hypothetical protein
MRAFLGSLRRLVLGETWTIPLGVAVSLLLALFLRAWLPEGTWQSAGGFALAALVIGALAYSLRTR